MSQSNARNATRGVTVSFDIQQQEEGKLPLVSLRIFFWKQKTQFFKLLVQIRNINFSCTGKSYYK